MRPGLKGTRKSVKCGPRPDLVVAPKQRTVKELPTQRQMVKKGSSAQLLFCLHGVLQGRGCQQCGREVGICDCVLSGAEARTSRAEISRPDPTSDTRVACETTQQPGDSLVLASAALEKEVYRDPDSLREAEATLSRLGAEDSRLSQLHEILLKTVDALVVPRGSAALEPQTTSCEPSSAVVVGGRENCSTKSTITGAKGVLSLEVPVTLSAPLVGSSPENLPSATLEAAAPSTDEVPTKDTVTNGNIKYLPMV